MQVFISHTFKSEDQILAENLKEILSEKGIEGYIAEKEKQYTILISEKIQRRIKESDHLVAIITTDALASASVNQELGYAIREGIDPIIMLEEEVKKMGVFTYGREPEEFTRENFKQSCNNVRDFLIGLGPRTKTSDNDMEYLRDNVYAPIFNKVANIFSNPVNRRKPPEDFLSKLSAVEKLKLESDVEEILQNYKHTRDEWENLFHTLNEDFEIQERKLTPIVSKIFSEEGMLNQSNSIILTSNTTMTVKEWLHAFSWVITETRIKNADEFYECLLAYSKETGIGHERWLKKFREEHPTLYPKIFEVLPELRTNFNTEFSNEKWEEIKKITFKLLGELQEKLKKKLVNF